MDNLKIEITADETGEDESIVITYYVNVPGVGYVYVSQDTYADRAAFDSGFATSLATAFPGNEPV